MMYLGIDPGKSGGFCLMDDDRKIHLLEKQPETDADVANLIRKVLDIVQREGHEMAAVIEKVHAMPGQGVTSMFSFGRNYGFLIGLLTAFRIPQHDVTPQRWQKDMQCQSKGDKNVTKQAAQQLIPGARITHAVADALLIAYWAVLQSNQGKL